MADPKKIRVGVNGYGVIGKRVAAAVACQEDMSLAGVSACFSVPEAPCCGGRTIPGRATRAGS